MHCNLFLAVVGGDSNGYFDALTMIPNHLRIWFSLCLVITLFITALSLLDLSANLTNLVKPSIMIRVKLCCLLIFCSNLTRLACLVNYLKAPKTYLVTFRLFFSNVIFSLRWSNLFLATKCLSESSVAFFRLTCLFIAIVLLFFRWLPALKNTFMKNFFIRSSDLRLIWYPIAVWKRSLRHARYHSLQIIIKCFF